MKALLIQPPYSADETRADELFQWRFHALDRVDPSVDVVVLPEYSEIPVATKSREDTLRLHNRFFEPLMRKCLDTAVKNQCLVFGNTLRKVGDNYRNTTFAIDKKGEFVFKYDKNHLPPFEKEVLGLDSEYTLTAREPAVFEYEGVRYGFLTCYDFYFYEAFSAIAAKNVDVLIGCSLQRSDTHDATETNCRFLAYQTNAYVLRSSVSFDENATVCGATMAVSPTGKVLRNLYGKFDTLSVEFDPKEKYYKPAGFGNPPAAHHDCIEYGRRPWQYRPAGSAIVPNDAEMPYPRAGVFIKGGLPDFGYAIGSDANELGADLSFRDNVWFVGEECELEALLRKFACHAVLFLRLEDDPGEAALRALLALLERYDSLKYACFSSKNPDLLEKLHSLNPGLSLCYAGTDPDPVGTALRLHCRKLLCSDSFDEKTAARAHQAGLVCVGIVCDEAQAANLLTLGADTILVDNR